MWEPDMQNRNFDNVKSSLQNKYIIADSLILLRIHGAKNNKLESSIY